MEERRRLWACGVDAVDGADEWPSGCERTAGRDAGDGAWSVKLGVIYACAGKDLEMVGGSVAAGCEMCGCVSEAQRKGSQVEVDRRD